MGAPRDEGASAVEYSLIAVAVAALVVVIVFVLGTQVFALFGSTCDKVETAGAQTAGDSCPN